MSIEHGVGNSYRREDGGRDWRIHRSDHDRSGPPRTAELDDLSFWDVLDIFNPLQHIPLLSIAYREITGDEIHPSARVLGGALYGGPLGMLAGAMNAAFEQETGRDIAGNVLAAIQGEDLGPGQTGGQLAETATPVSEGGPPIRAVAVKTPATADAAAMPLAVSAEAPAFPVVEESRFVLAPVPGGGMARPSGGPIHVSQGLDAALRALAESTGETAASPQRAAAAYRAP